MHWLEWWRPFTWRKAAAAAVAVALLLLAVVGGTWTFHYGRAIARLRQGVGDTQFYTADGKPWFRMDEQHIDVPLAQMSPFLRDAVVAVEDHRFYHHLGIDLIGVGRAVSRNVEQRQLAEGGSTLTQQLARTLFLSNSRTWGRKAKEAGLAVLLELELSKDRILELYLNRVFLGGSVYGVEPMSQRLYGKHARDLSLAEAAVIAGVIRAPSALSPWTNPDGAVRRSHIVLQRMREEKKISEAQEAEARAAHLAFKPYTASAIAHSGYLQDYLRQQFRNEFGGDHPPDWRVETTVVAGVQEAAERAVDAGLHRIGLRNLEAALVAFDPKTGDLLAMVGGHNYHESPFNRATRSKRQPGSAFKPFLYATALEHGFTPVSVLSGLAAMPPIGREEWTPRNAHEESDDALTLRAALLESNNKAAAALLQQVGTKPVIRLADRAGLAGQPDVPSLALGTGSVSPFDLALAYAVFPNGGSRVTARSLTRVVDADGGVVSSHEVGAIRVLSPESAFQMVSMLQDVIARGTGSGVRQWGVRGDVGGKTGTTDDFRDAWFVGFSSEIVAAVWVGFDQPASLGREAFGSRLALPIWADFMRRSARALPPSQPFAVPGTLEAVQLCRVSYLRPVEGCPTYTEYFKKGDDAPTKLCPIHQGSVKQRVERAVGGFLSFLGRKLKGLFSQ